MLYQIHRNKLLNIIKTTLNEDTYRDDITTNSIIPKNLNCTARIISEQKCIVSGMIVLKTLYQKILNGVTFFEKKTDGEVAFKNDTIAIIKGNAGKILSTERTALNFLQRMSSIATYTKKFVDIASKYNVAVYDTRKTSPCLRAIEKYAVSTAGGRNHRDNLSEDFFFKDNHFSLFKNLNKNELFSKIKNIIKRNPEKKVIVEAQNLTQLKFWLNFNVNIIILDNIKSEKLRDFVSLIRKSGKKIQIEASGGINLSNVEDICKCGVDRISLGCITASPPTLHFSLEILQKS